MRVSKLITLGLKKNNNRLVDEIWNSESAITKEIIFFSNIQESVAYWMQVKPICLEAMKTKKKKTKLYKIENEQGSDQEDVYITRSS